ncbi:oligosaccharide flippase family protein [Chryseomicrobium palamuruense]|uniref:Oligosaccharide flippase family protein n=1 Tax=Chryseomicrobium palamuruense TaxID=682973 RepID=A0ABV8UYJ5_9BACL
MSFRKGSLLLMGAYLITKVLGFIFRMQFVRIAGEESVGVYMAVYPAFIFFLAAIQLGLPVGVAKMTAIHTAENRLGRATDAYLAALKWVVISSAIFVPIFFYAIPYLMTELLQQSAAIQVGYAALIMAPITAVATLARAYFQGLTRMSETATSQILEQAIRILLVTFLLPYALTSTPHGMAVLAMLIALVAELVGLFYLWIRYKAVRVKGTGKPYPHKALLTPSLPASGSKLFGSFTWFLEPVLFLHALTRSGMAVAQATSLYGIISGVLVPMLLFPSFIPYALATVLIPAVSGAAASGRMTLVRDRVHLALRISAVTGVLSSTLLYVYGGELAELFFHTDKMTVYFHLLSPIFFFYYIQSPLFSILQAMDASHIAFRNSVLGGIGKLALLAALTADVSFKEQGAVLAIGFGVLITSGLHIASIRSIRSLEVGYLTFLPVYLIFLVGIALLPVLIPPSLPLIAQVAIGACLLLFILIVTRQLHVKDIALTWHLLKVSVKSI